MICARIGRFGVNTELYLCEHDVGLNRPMRRHIDLFYYGAWPIGNQQLARMWKWTLYIWLAWILRPIVRINRLISGGGSS